MGSFFLFILIYFFVNKFNFKKEAKQFFFIFWLNGNLNKS